MSYLVDTHILLWSLMEPEKLSSNVLKLYATGEEIQVSNISFWEISLKYRLGKLTLGGLTPDDCYQAAKDSHFQIVNIDAAIMATAYKLPLGKHKDPFDRILVWHAIQSDVTLVSRDSTLEQYMQEGLKLLS